MVNVFISYRRDDSAGYAGRLADSLEKLLGKEHVFRDVEDIKPGEDFVKAIERNLQSAMEVLSNEKIPIVLSREARQINMTNDQEK